MVKRRGLAALALGLALVIAAVGCAEDDDFLIGGKRPSTKPTTKPGGTGDTGGGNGDGSDLGGGIGTGDKPVATPTPAPTPTPTPEPTPPPSGTLVDSYPLQWENPESIAFDAQGNAWMANYGDGVFTSYVTKLDPSGQLLLEPPVGIAPKQVLVDRQGNAWVANSGSGTVTRIASDAGTTTSVEIGAAPRAMALSPDGDELWIAADTLVALDLASQATRSVVPFPTTGIAFHGGKAWVAYAASSSVGVYSLGGQFEREVTLNSSPGLVRASTDSVWVLTSTGGTRIEPETYATRDLSSGTSLDLAIDKDGGAWVSYSGSPGLIRRFAADGGFAGVVYLGLAPHGLAFHPSTGYLWVTDRTGQKVHVYVP